MHATLRPEDLFYCDACEYRAKRKISLQRHMKKKHTISQIQSGDQ